MQPDSPSKIASVFQNTLKGVENKNKNILNKVANLWMRDEQHDFNITLQRIVYLLKLGSGNRNADQLIFLRRYFETSFKYIEQFKDKMNESNYEDLYCELKYEHYKEHEIIFNHGDTGRKMYFILQGEVGILIPTGQPEEQNPTPGVKKLIKSFEDLVVHYYPNLRLVAVKTSKQYFGEIAIEQRIPRTATVVTKSECHFAVLSYESYQRILGQYKDQLMQQKLEFIQSIPLFQGFNKQGLFVLLHGCEEVSFSTKSVIYKRNKRGNYCYLIQQGEVIVESWVKIPNQNVTRNQTLGEDEIRKIQELIISKNHQHQVIGLYSVGQIFGDYEIHLNHFPKQVTRVSQATARVDTKAYQITYAQLYDCFRLFSSMERLEEFCSIKFQQKVFVPHCYSIQTKADQPANYESRQTHPERFTPIEGSIQKLLYRKVDTSGTMKLQALTRKYSNYITQSSATRILMLLNSIKKSETKEPFRHSVRQITSPKTSMIESPLLKPTSFQLINKASVRIKTSITSTNPFHELALETQRSLSPVTNAFRYFSRLTTEHSRPNTTQHFKVGNAPFKFDIQPVKTESQQ